MGDPVALDAFLKWQPAQLVPIISDGVFYEGSKAILYGKYGSLKSMLALRLSLAISRGEKWLEFDTCASDVLYLQIEIVEPELHKRISKMVAQNQTSVTGTTLWLWTERGGIKVDKPEGFERISQWVEKLKPRVLIIDPVYSVVSGDLLSTNHIQQLVGWLDTLMEKYGLSILLVHHSKKGNGDEWGSDNMLGSSVFNDWADTIIEIKRESHNSVKINFEKVRHAENEIRSKYFEVDFDNIDFVNSSRQV